jgi:hypothetical protein
VLWVSGSPWVAPCPLPLCGHPHACRRGQHAIEPLVFPWNDGRTPIARPSPCTPLPTMLSNLFCACVRDSAACGDAHGQAPRHPSPALSEATAVGVAWRVHHSDSYLSHVRTSAPSRAPASLPRWRFPPHSVGHTPHKNEFQVCSRFTLWHSIPTLCARTGRTLNVASPPGRPRLGLVINVCAQKVCMHKASVL